MLIRLPHAVTVALYADDWRHTVAAAQLLDGLGRASAALLFAHGHVDYVLTTEPDVYGGGIEIHLDR